jgi:hypothetical protein
MHLFSGPTSARLQIVVEKKSPPQAVEENAIEPMQAAE